MKHLILGICLILLVGCTGNKAIPNRDEIYVHVKLVDEINSHPNTYGLASCVEGICTILIRKDQYPRCITHEIRHGFEGNWHEGMETTAGCDVEE